MILMTHAIVGAGVAQLFPNHPVVGFLAGVASHYLSDTVPHWDYGKYLSSLQKKGTGPEEKFDRIVLGPKFLLESSVVLFDVVFGLLLSWLIWSNPSTGSLMLIVLGAFGGMLPDFLQIVYGFWKNKITSSLQRFHNFFHTPEKFKIEKLFGGILSQTVFVVLVVFVLRLVD